MNPNIQMLRQLTTELRQVVPSGSLRENLTLRYIFDQFQKYKITDQQLCKAQEEIKFMGNTYLCYLKSTRNYLKIHQNFQGKGERTVQDTANIVGFKLPHDPK